MDGNKPRADYAHIKSLLHTEAVTKSIQNHSPSRNFNIKPSPVAAEEDKPPRSYRSTPFQVSSGHCKALNGYRTDIGLTNDPICLSFGRGTQNPPHLFIFPQPISYCGEGLSGPQAICRPLLPFSISLLFPTSPPPEPPPATPTS